MCELFVSAGMTQVGVNKGEVLFVSAGMTQGGISRMCELFVSGK